MSKKSKQSSGDRLSPTDKQQQPVNLKSDSLINDSFHSEFVSGGTSSLLWKHLKQEHFADLEKLKDSDTEMIEKYLAKLFDLNEYETDLFQSLILEFYMTQYWWAAKEANFTAEQTSIYFSIAYTLFNNLKAARDNKNCLISDSVQDLKNVLVDLGKSSSCLFSEQQTKQIVDQLTLTLFQNFQAFKFAFVHPQQERVIDKQVLIECPKQPELPFPPPLQEAMPERMHNKYVLKLDDEEDQKAKDQLAADENNKKSREEEDKAENIALSAELVAQINKKFEGISVEDAKKIIFDVTSELVNDLKDSMKIRIKEREAALIQEITKSNEIAANATATGANRKKSSRAVNKK